MKVLVITGDKSFGPGHPRYDLQAGALERLEALYWGRESLWPALPPGPFDVVSAQDPLLRGLFAWRAAKRLGARLNVQVHMDLKALPWWRHVLAQIVLRHAGSVRVVSHKIKKQVEALGARAPVSVLPVFVDAQKYRAVVRKPDSKTILWIGRFEPEKDPLFALEVLRQVPGARLVMLGAGSLGKDLRRRAAGLPVELPGWQDPLPYLARAAVVLCTSRHESWGASIVEALAAGVPVVAPDVGIAREAGATVVSREHMPGVVAEALAANMPGQLLITLPAKDDWARQWAATL